MHRYKRLCIVGCSCWYDTDRTTADQDPPSTILPAHPTLHTCLTLGSTQLPARPTARPITSREADSTETLPTIRGLTVTSRQDSAAGNYKQVSANSGARGGYDKARADLTNTTSRSDSDQQTPERLPQENKRNLHSLRDLSHPRSARSSVAVS